MGREQTVEITVLVCPTDNLVSTIIVFCDFTVQFLYLKKIELVSIT